MIENPELKIKQLRELKNLKPQYVAEQLGITPRQYSKIESGETQLTVQRVNEISRILDVDPMDLLGFDSKRIVNFYNSHDINNIKHINLPEKLMEQYEKTITSQERTIKTLENEIELLKALIKPD